MEGGAFQHVGDDRLSHRALAQSRLSVAPSSHGRQWSRPQVAKVGNPWGQGVAIERPYIVRQRSLHALPLWTHPLKENPLFPLRLTVGVTCTPEGVCCREVDEHLCVDACWWRNVD